MHNTTKRGNDMSQAQAQIHNHFWELSVGMNDLLLLMGQSKEAVDFPMNAQQIHKARGEEEELLRDGEVIKIIERFELFFSEKLYRAVAEKIQKCLGGQIEGAFEIYPAHLRLLDRAGSHLIEPCLDHLATLVIFLPYTNAIDSKNQDMLLKFELSETAVYLSSERQDSQLAAVLHVKDGL
jgi:hypothetical protein